MQRGRHAGPIQRIAAVQQSADGGAREEANLPDLRLGAEQMPTVDPRRGAGQRHSAQGREEDAGGLGALRGSHGDDRGAERERRVRLRHVGRPEDEAIERRAGPHGLGEFGEHVLYELFAAVSHPHQSSARLLPLRRLCVGYQHGEQRWDERGAGQRVRRADVRDVGDADACDRAATIQERAVHVPAAVSGVHAARRAGASLRGAGRSVWRGGLRIRDSARI